MKKVGVFYGSSSGNTEGAAKLIANVLGIDKSDIFDVARAKSEQLLDYEILLFGSSTWGTGDLQDDWESFIGKMQKTDLSGKKVAVFGVGNSDANSDTFCNAIGIIAETAEQAGAMLIGNKVDPSDYSFDESNSVKEGVFCGLPLDEDNESGKTNERINCWVEQLKAEL